MKFRVTVVLQVHGTCEVEIPTDPSAEVKLDCTTHGMAPAICAFIGVKDEDAAYVATLTNMIGQCAALAVVGQAHKQIQAIIETSEVALRREAGEKPPPLPGGASA